jgi:hypothetical protein
MTTLVKQNSASALSFPEQDARMQSATLFEHLIGMQPQKQKSPKKARYLHHVHFNWDNFDVVGTHFIIRNTGFDDAVILPVTESYYTDNFDLSVKLIPSKIFKVKGRITKIRRFEPQVSLD